LTIKCLNANEIQYGITGYYDQAGLTGLNADQNDIIIEEVVRYYDKANYSHDRWGIVNAGLTNWLIVSPVLTGGLQQYRLRINNAGVGNETSAYLHNMFKDWLHVYIVIRHNDHVRFIANGQLLWPWTPGAVLNYNFNDFSRIYGSNTNCKGVQCLIRYYVGDLSGWTDAQILDIQRHYLRYPFIIPTEFSSMLKFKFTGRQQDGSQIFAASTNIYNEVNGETITIIGNNWDDVRYPIWKPR